MTTQRKRLIFGILFGILIALFAFLPGTVKGKFLATFRPKTTQSTVVTSNGTYVPPIGIPAPSFGINETYRMYDDPAKRNPDLTYTPSEEGGFYTHYVDYKNPNCTQYWVANNGTASSPRCTVPLELPAGSIVEIHGTYDYPNWRVDILSRGTKDSPVFVRGVGEDSRIVITMFVKGTYAILENLTFEDEDGNLAEGRGGNIFILAPASYVSLRHSELSGNLSREMGSGISVASWETGAKAENIVLYDNISRNHGQPKPLPTEPDQDFSGIVIAGGSSNVWVTDNEMYGNSGDGIMINANDGSEGSSIHHVYVGRNTTHDNQQSGFWVKSAKDIIFSQNISYNHRPAVSGAGTPGGCGGSQYGAQRVWFIYNNLYDCDYGIYISGGNSAQRSDESLYYIGNIIHGIHDSNGTFVASGYQKSAIMMAGGVNHYIVNNTMYDVDSGISSAAHTPFYVYNNIISSIAKSTGSHILLELAPDPNYPLGGWNVDNNLFYQNGENARIRLESTEMSLSGIQTARPGVCTNCVTSNPTFSSASNNNLHLSSASVGAIDKGTESPVYQTFQNLYGLDIRVDFDGNPRPQDGVWDIGAYEYGSGTTIVTEPPVTVITTYPVIATADSGGTINPSGTTQVTTGDDRSYTITPSSGYDIEDVQVDDASLGVKTTYTFTNVTAPHTIVANFTPEPLPAYILTTPTPTGGTITGNTTTYTSDTTARLTAVPSTGYTFGSWTGCSSTSGNTCAVLMNSDKTVTATFILTPIATTYALITAASLGGRIDGNTNIYSSGVTAAITAVADAGYTFVSWTGCTATLGTTCTILMNADKTVTATFALNAAATTFTLTASANPGGSISPVGSMQVTPGYTQSYSIVPSSGYTIADVKVDGVSQGAKTSYTFTNITASHTITATFALTTTYTLTATSTTGGYVTGNNSSYRSGDLANLTANANTGYTFLNWTGCATPSGTTCTVLMNADKTVTANFTPTSSGGGEGGSSIQTTYTLTIRSNTGGIITGNTTPYKAGGTATLTAIPKTGYVFSGWTGCTSKLSTICTVTMSGNKIVTAKFTLAPNGPYNLTVMRIGTGSGTISGLKTSYTRWTKASLTAKTITGSVFAGWSGACTNLTGRCIIVMDSHKTVTAIFNKK